jgi:hypothetical protein
MESKVLLRGSYRGSFTKFVSKLKADLKRDDIDSDEYSVWLTILEEK